jgi:hypothetical protein
MNARPINIGSIVFKILFFAVAWVYILRAVNPEITYFIQQPAFYLGKRYIYEHLSYPGGVIEYVSAFLSQFFYFPWIGALVFVLVIWTISFITGRILKSIGFNAFNLLLQLFPAILLLYIHSSNDYILATTMILLSSVLFFYLYILIRNKTAIIRSAMLIMSSAALFYISGGGALLHYIFLCLLFEIFDIRGYKTALIILASLLFAALIPYLSARFLFYIGMKQAYFFLLLPEPYYHPPVLLYVLFLFYAVPIVLNVLKRYNIISGDHIFNAGTVAGKELLPYLMLATEVVIVSGLTVLTMIFAVKPEQKFVNNIRYLAYNEEWEQILELVRKHPSKDMFVNFHTARALYHTGKMADDLFNYTQYWGKHSLFLGEIISRTLLMDNSDVYFDLGHIRAAQHWAYEAQTIYENSPRIIKRLALTNIILGNYKAAASILGILKNNMIYRKWANHYLQYLDDPSKLTEDSLIMEKRNMLPAGIFFTDRENVNHDLALLVKENPKNRMAFEYLMAYYLLSNEVTNVVSNFRYLEGLGYKKIPRTYEEAFMVYITRKNIKRIDLGEYKISNNTIEKYKDYARIFINHKNNLRAAQGDLYKMHGNTYWYYLNFDSPVTKGRKLQFKVKE